jgi:hypothetical protein
VLINPMKHWPCSIQLTAVEISDVVLHLEFAWSSPGVICSSLDKDLVSWVIGSSHGS